MKTLSFSKTRLQRRLSQRNLLKETFSKTLSQKTLVTTMGSRQMQTVGALAFGPTTAVSVGIDSFRPRLQHTCHRRASSGRIAQVCGFERVLPLATVRMADISKPRPGVGGPKGPSFQEPDRGGGVAVITKPSVKEKTKRKSKTEHEPSWRVLLHNDDVHTFDYVTGAIVKVGVMGNCFFFHRFFCETMP